MAFRRSFELWRYGVPLRYIFFLSLFSRGNS
jgi:hypothetical protein